MSGTIILLPCFATKRIPPHAGVFLNTKPGYKQPLRQIISLLFCQIRLYPLLSPFVHVLVEFFVKKNIVLGRHSGGCTQGYTEEFAAKLIHQIIVPKINDSLAPLLQALQICEETRVRSDSLLAEEGRKICQGVNTVVAGAGRGTAGAVLVACAPCILATSCAFAVDVFGLDMLVQCPKQESQTMRGKWGWELFASVTSTILISFSLLIWAGASRDRNPAI
jgi:hypothetical protein